MPANTFIVQNLAQFVKKIGDVMTGALGINTPSTPTELLDIYNGNLVVRQGQHKSIIEARAAAPTATLVADGTGLLSNGAYRYCVGLVTQYGEVGIGDASVAVTVDVTHKKITLSAIPTGTVGVVTARKVYRTLAGGATYYLLTTISDNTTTTYTDNTADASLGARMYLVNAPSVDTGTGVIIGGTYEATMPVKLDISYSAAFPASAFAFPNYGRFLAAEVGIAGTNDIFFQLLPGSTAGYGYLEAWAGAGLIVGSGNQTPIIFKLNRLEGGRITISSANAMSFVWGTAALATTATDGFLYIPSCAGPPTGVPTANTGRVPITYDSTNNQIYVYNGGWKKTAVLT